MTRLKYNAYKFQHELVIFMIGPAKIYFSDIPKFLILYDNRKKEVAIPIDSFIDHFIIVRITNDSREELNP